MRSVRKFLLLSGREKLLLFEALLLLSTTRTALALLPFQAVRRFLEHLAKPKRELPGHAEVESIVWATQVTALRFPGVGTCLTQALTAYVLLARIGYQTDFRIGVSKDHLGKFIAHAWLEKDDRVLIGGLGEQPVRYRPFPARRSRL